MTISKFCSFEENIPISAIFDDFSIKIIFSSSFYKKYQPKWATRTPIYGFLGCQNSHSQPLMVVIILMAVQNVGNDHIQIRAMKQHSYQF
jgi:hypothetical protein